MVKYKKIVGAKEEIILNKDTINFKEYDIEFGKDEFKNMTKKELEECDEILKKIEEIVNKK